MTDATGGAVAHESRGARTPRTSDAQPSKHVPDDQLERLRDLRMEWELRVALKEFSEKHGIKIEEEK